MTEHSIFRQILFAFHPSGPFSVILAVLTFNLNATPRPHPAFPQLTQHDDIGLRSPRATFPLVDWSWSRSHPVHRGTLCQPAARPFRTQRNELCFFK